MEQVFFNRLKHLRCDHELSIERHGPQHMSTATATLSVRRYGDTLFRCSAEASKNKDAVREVIRESMSYVDRIDDPCTETIMYESLWEEHAQTIVAFHVPPPSWFDNTSPQVLGIDFEGQPPCICQIACDRGVYIDEIDTPLVQQILRNPMFTHAVFGEHEMKYVMNGTNIQKNKTLSLAETVSRYFYPKTRILKDKKIHEIADWKKPSSLTVRLLRYAALDALVTRKIALMQLAMRTTENGTNEPSEHVSCNHKDQNGHRSDSVSPVEGV